MLRVASSLFIIILCSAFMNVKAQGFNEEKIALANFIKRMYGNTPFEGVKVMEDYNKKFLISVLVLDQAKYPSKSTMIRVAQTKAQSQANTFFNGSTITTDFIIKTTEEKQNAEITATIVETIEAIRERSIGFVKGLELLTNFEAHDNKQMVFVYYRELSIE